MSVISVVEWEKGQRRTVARGSTAFIATWRSK